MADAESAINSRIGSGLQEWVRRMGHHDAGSSIHDVAEELGVTSQQLAWYFKNVHGTSFTQWRKQLRIEDARILMSTRPELSISQIGRMVGIPDRSNFGKRFKDVMGCMPSEYRRTISN